MYALLYLLKLKKKQFDGSLILEGGAKMFEVVFMITPINVVVR